MAHSALSLQVWMVIALAVLVASSVALSSDAYANTTYFSSAVSTSSSSLRTSSLLTNSSCSSCVIAACSPGLQQVFWLSETTWSVTLDTEYVTVTIFNGSNVSATNNTITVLGDVQSLDPNTDSNPYYYKLKSWQGILHDYFNVNATLVRGTDGSVGTTSFPYGQPFAQITGIDYRYMVHNDDCPMNMAHYQYQYEDDGCICLMNSYFAISNDFYPGVEFKRYSLDRTYYVPLQSDQMNEARVDVAGMTDSLYPWDGEQFSAWLAEDEDFKSAFPNWQDCAFWNTAAGPPGVKIPVSALTTTVSTTVQGTVPKSRSMPLPASSHPLPTPTATSSALVSSNSVSSALSSPGAGGGSESRLSGSRHWELGNAGTSSNTGSSKTTVVAVTQTLKGGSSSLETTGTVGSTVSAATEALHSGGSEDSSTGSIIPGPSSKSQGEGEFSEDFGFTDSISIFDSSGLQGGRQTIGAILGSSGVYYVGNTLVNGPHMTSDSTKIDVRSSDLAVGGTFTTGISTPTSTSSNSGSQVNSGLVTFTAAGFTITSSSNGIAVGGITIQLGDTGVISDTTISYGANGLAIGTFSLPVLGPFPSSAISESVSEVSFTLAGQTFVANATAIAIDGTTLTAGGPTITIGGTPIALGTFSSGLIIASSTYVIPTSTFRSNTTIVIGSEAITILPTAIEMDGSTITESASSYLIDGIPVSFGPSEVVVAGTTISYHEGPGTVNNQTSQGLGAIILGGFGPHTTSAISTTGSGIAQNTSTPELASYTGTASKLRGSLWDSIVGLEVLFMALWMIHIL